MKYPITAYAKALAGALESKPAEVRAIASRFVKFLERTGDRPAMGRIVEVAEGMLLARRGGKKVIVESARPLGKDAVTQLARSFGKEDAIEYRIQPELVAGVRIRIGEDALVDASLVGRLNRLTSKLRNL